jgi:RHS repeat-associated protein
MGIYVANVLNLKPMERRWTPNWHLRQAVIQAWDNCGAALTTPVSFGVTAAAPTTRFGVVYKYVITPNGGPSGYAPNGNLLSYTDSVTGSWQYGYDNLNRVTSSQLTSAAANTYAFGCWGYDSFGNRLAQGTSNQACPTSPSSPCQAASSALFNLNSAIYSKNNQISSTTASGALVQPAYDQAGNIINDGVNSYLCDAEGRLCAEASYPISGGAVMTQYLYDAEGRRVAKGTLQTMSCDSTSNGFILTAQYLPGPAGEQETEIAPNGSAVHTNVYEAGSLIATYGTDSPNPRFQLTDWLGTRRAQTNYSGVLEETYTSFPFGDQFQAQTVTSSAYDPTEQHFTGKERDAESGLDYFGARYMASSMGRFMSPDPLLNSGRPDNPQTWNRYTYALNNPLTITDPTGLYNLINNCAADNKRCNSDFNKEAKQLKDGLAALTKAVNGLKDGDQKTDLQGALGAIGTENDGNNVGVQFGALGVNAAGETNINVSAAGAVTGYTVTFDPGKTHGMFDQAINAAHEGQHVEDLGDQRFANNATTLSPFSTEYRGYRTSAYAASALGQNLSYGKNGQYPIWNGSWGAVDRNLTNYITTFRDKQGQPNHPETTPHDPWSQM